MEDGDVLDTFTLTEPAAVYAGPGGRYGYAVQRDADVGNTRRNGTLRGHFVGPHPRDRGRWSANPLHCLGC